MRVFSMNQKISNGSRLIESVNCQLTSNDLLVIKTCLENFKKFDNDVLESCRLDIVEQIKSVES